MNKNILDKVSIPEAEKKLFAQLTTTLAHLKAVLGDVDINIENDCIGDCGNITLKELCDNHDCPRYQARQYVAKMEAGR